MKHHKSSIQDLRSVFSQGIPVHSITEPLVSFDARRKTGEIRAFMENRDFDVVGVRMNGRIAGYAERAVMKGESLEACMKPFDDACLLDSTAPLGDALEALSGSPRAFVFVLGDVGGILTKGDLHKAPVSMWVFGLLSLLEMQFLRLIRSAYPDEGWQRILSKKRLAAAADIAEDRKRRNEDIDLADCLQFCDKYGIIVATDSLCGQLFGKDTGKRSVRRSLKRFEKLRNDLVHAQDFVNAHWPELPVLVNEAETLLEKCEQVSCIPEC